MIYLLLLVNMLFSYELSGVLDIAQLPKNSTPMLPASFIFIVSVRI
jgi:hypothetical protein